MFNFVTVSLPNSPAPPQRVFKMSYQQEHYAHDYAKLYFRDWAVSMRQVKPGTPMKVKIDNKEIVGYVHDIKNVQNAQKNFTEITFIGASYVMRQSSQQVYKNATVDQVIKQIAIKYNFAYKLTPHPRVFPHISQGGLTDWEFMVKLAKQVGYLLRAEGTSLFFHPLLQDFNDLIGEAPIFTKNDAGFKNENGIYHFAPVVGETLSHFGADKSATSVGGVNPRTGVPFKFTKQPRTATTRVISQADLFDRHATNVVANDYTTASFESYAADDKSTFPYAAETEVMGMASLRPGHPIYINNVGPEYSGYWTILEVRHEVIEEQLNVQRYTTHLLLGTDSLGGLVDKSVAPMPNPKRVRTITPNVRNTRVVPKSKLNTSSINLTTAQQVSLVSRINRAAPAGKAVSATAWQSTHGDLNLQPANVTMDPATQLKVAATIARY